MDVKIITSKKFRRKARPLLKKYHSLSGELKELENQLIKNPKLGISIGKKCYKIKLAVKSKGKGKRGGLRVITYIVIKIINEINELKIINLVTIFDKSEYSNISDNELKEAIREIDKESKDLF